VVDVSIIDKEDLSARLCCFVSVTSPHHYDGNPIVNGDDLPD
jgi:hypothetical protein